MNRISFLIDGFNLYHSVSDAWRQLNPPGTAIADIRPTKWLDIKRLCHSYGYLYGRAVNDRQIKFRNIYYFSAYALHRLPIDPDVVNRHKALIDCFEDTGVIVDMNQFKEKTMKCPDCGHRWTKHEEKETDVAIGVKLLEVFHQNECDTAVIMSGDTDLAPAVKTANRLFPQKRILFMFPFGRMNKSLKILSPGSFKIKAKSYTNYQFPAPYTCQNGSVIQKPTGW